MSTDFLHEYSSFLMESDLQRLPIIYAGDFISWFDESPNLETKMFADTLITLANKIWLFQSFFDKLWFFDNL